MQTFRAQVSEMALSRNLNDISTAQMMAYANWVMETDPEQKTVLKGLLTEMQESEAMMKAKIGEAQNDTHLLLGGPPSLTLPPIHTATNITSPPPSSLQDELRSSAWSQNAQPVVSPMTIRRQ